MAQKWDYAELSKAAKMAGGPEKYVEMLESASKDAGKMEMLPWIPVYPVKIVCLALQPVRAWDLKEKPSRLSRRSFDRDTPVLRPSSARLIVSREKLSPCTDFISSMACDIMNSKPLLLLSFMRLLSLGCWHFPV